MICYIFVPIEVSWLLCYGVVMHITAVWVSVKAVHLLSHVVLSYAYAYGPLYLCRATLHPCAHSYLEHVYCYCLIKGSMLLGFRPLLVANNTSVHCSCAQKQDVMCLHALMF